MLSFCSLVFVRRCATLGVVLRLPSLVFFVPFLHCPRWYLLLGLFGAAYLYCGKEKIKPYSYYFELFPSSTRYTTAYSYSYHPIFPNSTLFCGRSQPMERWGTRPDVTFYEERGNVGRSFPLGRARELHVKVARALLRTLVIAFRCCI